MVGTRDAKDPNKLGLLPTLIVLLWNFANCPNWPTLKSL